MPTSRSTRRLRASVRSSAISLSPTDPRNPGPSSLAVRAVMTANRGRGTSPERQLARELRSRGAIGYRLNRRVEGVRPDLVYGRAKVAVFVHGCFWHRCATCDLPLPARNRAFWAAKFRRNRARDRQKRARLEAAGWGVVEVWTHELEQEPERAVRRLVSLVERRRGLRTSGLVRGAASPGGRSRGR